MINVVTFTILIIDLLNLDLSTYIKASLPKNNKDSCFKPCKKSGEEEECKKDTINGKDESGCLFEICYANGSCGPLVK